MAAEASFLGVGAGMERPPEPPSAAAHLAPACGPWSPSPRPVPGFHPAAIEGALPRLEQIRAEIEEKCDCLLGFLCNPLLFSHHVASRSLPSRGETR